MQQYSQIQNQQIQSSISQQISTKITSKISQLITQSSQTSINIYQSITYRNPCQKIIYLDCRNWFEFSQEILATILAFLLFLHVAKHYRNLKKQKQQQALTQHQKSVRRKIRVNLIIIIYLLCLILNTIFDMSLFFWYKNQPYSIIGNIDKLYKISQVMYVNWLNVLNLTVGFLYWKATRAYYVLIELTLPVLFRPFGKVIFFILFCINASAVIITCIFLFVIYKGNQQSQQQNKQFAILTLISTSISIIVCIGCRILYRFHILTKLQLSQKAVTKQKVMSALLLISSILRIIVYSMDLIQPNWIQKLRNQEYTFDEKSVDGQGYCIDKNVYYAFILLGINLLINLLPAAIYGYLFISEADLKTSKRLITRSQDSEQAD